MADSLNTDDYKLDYTGGKAGMEDYGKQLSEPLNPVINQDDKSELESFYYFNAGLLQFFRGIDNQITTVLNAPVVHPIIVEQIQTQVQTQLPALNKLKFTISMFNPGSLSEKYKALVNQHIAYTQNGMTIGEVEIAAKELSDLLSRNEAAVAKEQEDLKRQQEEEQIRIAREEEQKRIASEEAKRKAWIIEMVAVEGGTFIMGATPEQGSDCYDNEKPVHRVTLNNFHIGKYPVTQAQLQAVMGENPSSFKGDNLPVETVSWDDVQVFISRLNAATGKNYRLPTEAEWEYAARGGNRSKGYKYSGSNNCNDAAWYYGNSGNTTHPVGTKSPNELGIYDMSGNVFEWCQDWYGEYNSSAQANPKGPSSGSYRVLRGGGWSGGARDCRVSDRYCYSPGNRDNDSGFRLASVP